MLQNFVSLLSPINLVVLLITITVLVAAHEYGHYLFARLFGMGVEEFAIGFGRKPLWIYGRKKYRLAVKPGEVARTPTGGEVPIDPSVTAVEETTNFTVRPWPLGGFVRIKGMLPEEDGSETRIAGGFYSKPPWQRFIVLLAGPVFSVLAGILLMIPVIWSAGDLKFYNDPVLGTVNLDQPAYKAGLRQDDRIVSVDGKPIGTFFEMVQIVRKSNGRPLEFVYEREGQRHTTTVHPEKDRQPTVVLDANFEPTARMEIQSKISVMPRSTVIHMSLASATTQAFGIPGRILGLLGGLLAQPAMLKQNVGGPLTMLQATQQAVKGGLADIIRTAAMLSISVGIFNLLPIPPLDGGQMAIAVAEMFRRGRRLSIAVQNMVAAAGITLVLTLFVTVLFIDVQRVGQPKEPELVPAPPPVKQAPKK